ncbi:MAG: type IV secretory system conjugative DNA transfer family protein [Candidatus Binataceae bacterium]
MAEQRPYRLAGSADAARLTHVKLAALFLLGPAFIAINWIATQHAARLFGYAPALGAPLCNLPIAGILYRPWDWIVWWTRYYSEPSLAPVWEHCARVTLVPMAGLTAIAIGAIAVARHGWLQNSSDLHGSARWASIGNLRAAGLVADNRRAGVYLARWRAWNRRYHLRDSGPSHVLVFAPTRSGKGVGIVIPTLLTWPHSALIHDLKGENWALTAGARKRMGHVCLKFAPASPDSDCARFNPLAEVRLRSPHEIRDVRNIAQMIMDPNGKGLPDHWLRAGVEGLTGFLLAQCYEGRNPTLSGIEARLSDPAQPIGETLEQIMHTVHDPDGKMGWKDSQGIPTKTHPVAARAMRSLLDKSENERSGVISEIKGFLELYRDPMIAANTAASDFRIEDLMNHERPVSLYIVVALAHKDSLRPLIRLMLSQILHRLTEHLEYRNGRATTRYRRRLLLMIDEFASLGRLDMFADSLSLIAGYGIKACLIAQDLSQIHAAYGHDEAITSNCHARVAFTPNRIETARLISQMAGEATVRHLHRTVSSAGESVSEPETARALITPDEAMRLGANEALIFTSGHPTIRAEKIRYYADPIFKRLAALPPPAKSDRIEPNTAPADASDAANPKPEEKEIAFLKFAADEGAGEPPAPDSELKAVTLKGKERLL